MNYMDDLKKLDTKTAVSIFCFFWGLVLPGFLTLFKYKQDLVYNLDVFKLLILSLAISAPGIIIPMIFSRAVYSSINKLVDVGFKLGTPFDWFLFHCVTNGINFYLALVVSYLFELPFGWFIGIVLVLTFLNAIIFEPRRMVKAADGDDFHKSILDE